MRDKWDYLVQHLKRAGIAGIACEMRNVTDPEGNFLRKRI